jgi:hypothetical protein
LLFFEKKTISPPEDSSLEDMYGIDLDNIDSIRAERIRSLMAAKETAAKAAADLEWLERHTVDPRRSWVRSITEQAQAYRHHYPGGRRDYNDSTYNPKSTCQGPVEEMMSRLSSQREANFKKIEKPVVLNLGPLKGKWLPELCGTLSPRKIVLVDLMSNYFDFLSEKIKKINTLIETEFCVINAPRLDSITTSSIDYIWSSDAITRSSPAEIRSYLKEFKRVLKKDGIGMIHVADRESALQNQRTGYSLARDEIVDMCEELDFNILAFEKPLKLGVFVILTPDKQRTLQ